MKEPFKMTTNDASVMMVDGVAVPLPNNPNHPDFEKEKKEAEAAAAKAKEEVPKEVSKEDHGEVTEHVDGA